MSSGHNRYEVGELRPSQIIHTFGIGAVVDLPHLSVLVMGLDEWPALPGSEISEERLLRAVQAELGQQVQKLHLPPVRNEDNPLLGLPVAPFPRWMVCPVCRLLSPLDDGIFTIKQAWNRPDQTRYVHEGCGKKKSARPTVLPVRFLVACEHGHLDDFPWAYFVHRGAACPQTEGSTLRLYEHGISGEASDILVECSCGAKRTMADAFGETGKRTMPACRGRYPHLREFDTTPCPQQMRTILLGASNSWFSLSLSALSVPTATNRLGNLVDEHWHTLEQALNAQNVELLLRVGKLNHLLEYTPDDIWAAVEAKRSGEESDETRSLKGPEWHTLTSPSTAPTMPDFQVREVAPPPGYEPYIERVVLVERLREVRAMLGFTRIVSPGNFAEASEVPHTERAPLTRQAPTWVPATEVHGEGIFIQFNEERIAEWLATPAVAAYERDFWQAHSSWRASRRVPNPQQHFPGARFVLLHTLAHALIRQVSLECGYTAASLRERIYALPPEHPEGAMAGFLISTAAPDSEGTLGGLVNLGTPAELARHLDAALEQVQRCASDPLCAEHAPITEPHSLHGAACHACVFVSETSCERGNRYLDRSLLVPTVEQRTRALAFFAERVTP